mgnify:FL=1
MVENNLQLKTPFGYTFGQDFVKEDLSELKSIKLFAKGTAQGAQGETYGQNPFSILKYYPYSEKILTNYFQKFADAFYGRRVNFKITTSWAVKLTKGEAVHHHNHNNCIWSAVYYYGKYTEKSCPLMFVNPINVSTLFRIDGAPNTHNPMITDIAIAPETDKIIFFPSWIYHYSHLNMEDTRYSLAFNLMSTDEIGMGDSTYSPRMMIDDSKSKSLKGFG